LGSFGSELFPRASGKQVGGGSRVAEPKAVPCRVTARHGGSLLFVLGTFPLRCCSGCGR